jgi:hypothetical protein
MNASTSSQNVPVGDWLTLYLRSVHTVGYASGQDCADRFARDGALVVGEPVPKLTL